jgi:hypothetical protein
VTEPILRSRAGVTDHPWRVATVPRGGVLTLDDDRLTFESDEGELALDTPLARISKLWTRWYQLGTGFFLKVGDVTYLVTFFRVPGGTTALSGRLLQSGDRLGQALGVAGLAESAAGLFSGNRRGQLWLKALRAHLVDVKRHDPVTEPRGRLA